MGDSSVVATTFHDLYHLTNEILGQGAYASVRTCRNIWTDQEFAVKIIDKVPGHSRSRVFKEIDTFYHCRGHKNIIQLIEYFEESDRFYLVFEKSKGGQLRHSRSGLGSAILAQERDRTPGLEAGECA